MSLSKTLKHFGFQTLQINGYNFFNPIIFNVFDVSNAFHVVFKLFTLFDTFQI